MVVFSCQHTNSNDSSDNPKAYHFISCVDCLKNFIGDVFLPNTQCSAEAQQCSSTVFEENRGRSKGAQRMATIQTVLKTNSNLSQIQRKLLELCSKHTNVPRKLTKFENYMKLVAKKVVHTKQDIASIFDLIQDQQKIEARAIKHCSGCPMKTWSTLTTENLQKPDEKINKLRESDKIMHRLTGMVVDREDKHMSSNDHQDEVIDFDSDAGDPRNEMNGASNPFPGGKVKKCKKIKCITNQYEENRRIDNHSFIHDEYINSKTVNSIDADKDTKKSKKVLKESLVKEENKENLGKSKKKVKKQNKCENSLIRELLSKELDSINKGLENSFEKGRKQLKKSKSVSKKTDQHVPISNILESTHVMNVNSQETSKKNKRKQIDSQCKTTEKKNKTLLSEKGEQMRKSETKFHWSKEIVRALESRPDKELSLKKLGKKVIDEYQNVKDPGCMLTSEELLAKFNKKVNKTRGVQVFNDKAKIIV